MEPLSHLHRVFCGLWVGFPVTLAKRQCRLVRLVFISRVCRLEGTATHAECRPLASCWASKKADLSSGRSATQRQSRRFSPLPALSPERTGLQRYRSARATWKTRAFAYVNSTKTSQEKSTLGEVGKKREGPNILAL